MKNSGRRGRKLKKLTDKTENKTEESKRNNSAKKKKRRI